MSKFVSYKHHTDQEVFVREDLKGKHREHCLCYSCDRYREITDKFMGENACPVAETVYFNCVMYDIVTPVWECPRFVEKKDGSN